MRHRLQCASVRLELTRYELKLEISELKIVETKKKGEINLFIPVLNRTHPHNLAPKCTDVPHAGEKGRKAKISNVNHDQIHHGSTLMMVTNLEGAGGPV